MRGIREDEMTDAQFRKAVDMVADRVHAFTYPRPIFMSTADAEDEYNIPAATVRWACREGRIASAELKRRKWRFTRQALLDWMAKPQKTGRPRKWKKGK